MLKYSIKKRLYCIIFLVVTGGYVYSQTSAQPQIIPPSPKAQMFDRFSYYPVTPNTGAPDISIPLYTIKSGSLEVPIILRYHIGNVKPGYDPSDIGFGWVLDVGGQISRVIMGGPDDASPRLENKYFNSELDQSVWENVQQFDYCLKGEVDSEYDIFNYSLPSQNGEFIIKKDNLGKYQAHLMPYKPFKFEFSTQPKENAPSKYVISTIKVTNSSGTLYTFGDGAVETCYVAGSIYAPTTWKLKNITHVNQVDQINFTYNKVQGYGVTLFGDPAGSITTDGGHDFATRCANNLYPEKSPEINCENTSTMYNYELLTIKEVSFNSGKIVFDLSADNKEVNGLTVYDNQSNIIKKIVFYKSRFSPTTNYLRLYSLRIFDRNISDYQEYNFKYDEKIIGNSTDYWGYYNGSSGGCTKRSYMYIDSRVYSSPIMYTQDLFDGIKTPNASAAQAQILKKIIFPTKGETEFFYESNKYIEFNNGYAQEVDGGGLRIGSIVNRDGLGKEMKKTYLYEGGFVRHSLAIPVNYTTTTFTVDGPYGPCSSYFAFRNRYFSSSINSDLGDNSVRYNKVTETFGDLYHSNAGKIVYTYKYNNSSLFTGYTSSISELDIGRTILYDRRDWDNGELFEKDVLTFNMDGTADTLIKERNYYVHNLDNQVFHNLKIFRLTYFPGNSIYDEWHTLRWMRDDPLIEPLEKYKLFGSYNYYISTGRTHLYRKIISEYFKKGSTKDSLVTETKYYYENELHDLVTKTETKTSTGKVVVANTYYPQDFSFSDFSGFISKNIIEIPIDQRLYTDGKLTSGRLTKYNLEGLPLETYNAEVELGTSLLVNKTTPYSYGSLKEVLDYQNNRLSFYKRVNDMNSCYIWGYRHSYPIIKAENIDFNTLNSAVSSSTPDLEKLLADIGDMTSVAQKELWKSFYLSLRSKLPLACHLTTYTYDPLVGMTSQTDPNGEAIYYEYDGFGRLKNVKNHQGNIVQQYEYHYQNN